MKDLSHQQQMLITDRTITDPKEIAFWDNEFKGEFWIHPNDFKTINTKLIRSGKYSISKNLTGEHSSIYVVVCPSDPYKDSEVSMYRIHRRIGDGIHRYLSEKEEKRVWSHKYIKLNNFDEFMFLWLQFGSQKPDETAKLQRLEKVKEYCNYAYDVIGIKPKEKVSAYVKKKLGNNHPFPTSTLYELIPEEFKDKVRQKARLLDKSSKPKKKSKKDLEIEKLLKERDFHIKTIDELKIRVKPPDEKDKIIKDLEIKHQENITKILRLERDVKELNQKLKGKILS